MKSTQNGFTLIEVVIALVILAILTTLSSQAIRSAVQNKSRYQDIIEDEATFRDTLNVVQRDIEMAYHHLDYSVQMINEINKEKVAPPPQKPGEGQKGDQAQPPGDNPAQPPPQPPQPTGAAPKVEVKNPYPNYTSFQGEKEKIDLTTISNVRTQKDALESDQAIVGYYLDTCKAGDKDKAPTKCLWRRTSPYLDEDITIGGTAVPILENVTQLSFRYFGAGQQDWVDQWRTGKQAGAGNTKDNFPYAVEMTIQVVSPKGRKMGQTLIIPIRFPNNPVKKKEPNSGQTTNPGEQQQPQQPQPPNP